MNRTLNTDHSMANVPTNEQILTNEMTSADSPEGNGSTEHVPFSFWSSMKLIVAQLSIEAPDNVNKLP